MRACAARWAAGRRAVARADRAAWARVTPPVVPGPPPEPRPTATHAPGPRLLAPYRPALSPPPRRPCDLTHPRRARSAAHRAPASEPQIPRPLNPRPVNRGSPMPPQDRPSPPRAPQRRRPGPRASRAAPRATAGRAGRDPARPAARQRPAQHPRRPRPLWLRLLHSPTQPPRRRQPARPRSGLPLQPHQEPRRRQGPDCWAGGARVRAPRPTAAPMLQQSPGSGSVPAPPDPRPSRQAHSGRRCARAARGTTDPARTAALR